MNRIVGNIGIVLTLFSLACESHTETVVTTTAPVSDVAAPQANADGAVPSQVDQSEPSFGRGGELLTALAGYNPDEITAFMLAESGTSLSLQGDGGARTLYLVGRDSTTPRPAPVSTQATDRISALERIGDYLLLTMADVLYRGEQTCQIIVLAIRTGQLYCAPNVNKETSANFSADASGKIIYFSGYSQIPGEHTGYSSLYQLNLTDISNLTLNLVHRGDGHIGSFTANGRGDVMFAVDSRVLARRVLMVKTLEGATHTAGRADWVSCMSAAPWDAATFLYSSAEMGLQIQLASVSNGQLDVANHPWDRMNSPLEFSYCSGILGTNDAVVWAPDFGSGGQKSAFLVRVSQTDAVKIPIEGAPAVHTIVGDMDQLYALVMDDQYRTAIARLTSSTAEMTSYEQSMVVNFGEYLITSISYAKDRREVTFSGIRQSDSTFIVAKLTGSGIQIISQSNSRRTQQLITL